MLEVHSVYLNCKISGDDFQRIVAEISRSEYKGVIHSMCVTALSQLGVNKITNKDLAAIRPSFYQYEYIGDGRQGRVRTDCEFFKYTGLNKTFLYLINGPAIDIKYNDKVESYQLEAGIITDNLGAAANAFVEFQELAKKSFTDSKLKLNPKSTWLAVSKRVDFSVFSWYKDENSFALPDYSKQEIEASLVICKKENRTQLLTIGQAGFAREQDLFAKGNKLENNSEKTVTELSEKGLLKTQGLLQCRKRQLPLMRLEDMNQMENETIKKLKCGLCGSNYEDELIVKGYSLSDLGRKLMDKSHWMTILLTDQLIQKGLEKDSILWNITSASEEVDLIVGQKGQLWVFELKDREFSTGDAYALNYRRSKFNATKPVVFTTEKVSPDAKKVFKDIVNEVSQNVKDSVIPLYIEGIEEVSQKLDELISETALQTMHNKVKVLDNLTKISFTQVLEKMFGVELSRFDDDNDLPF